MPGNLAAVVVMDVLQVVVLKRRRKICGRHGDNVPSGQWGWMYQLACGAGRGSASAAATLSFSRPWGLDLLSCLMSGSARGQAAGCLYDEEHGS